MPRAKKTVEAPEVAKKPRAKKAEPPPPVSKKEKKPYPSRDERIVNVDKEIAHWECLNEKRRGLIIDAEKVVTDRTALLEKGEAELIKLYAWKERLIGIRDGTNKPSVAKQQYAELIAALKVSGKSVDDLIIELKAAEG
jgi:hypothetical protein